jgi:hypothetical protein
MVVAIAVVVVALLFPAGVEAAMVLSIRGVAIGVKLYYS